jgi:hypothetical protein
MFPRHPRHTHISTSLDSNTQRQHERPIIKLDTSSASTSARCRQIQSDARKAFDKQAGPLVTEPLIASRAKAATEGRARKQKQKAEVARLAEVRRCEEVKRKYEEGGKDWETEDRRRYEAECHRRELEEHRRLMREMKARRDYATLFNAGPWC